MTVKGKNCFHPKKYIVLNNDGFANLYPTSNKIAARTDNGIRFNNLGIMSTEINKNIP